MAKAMILFLALLVFVAHCNVIREIDPTTSKAQHNREKRSCHECDNNRPHGPPLPPYPPFFDLSKNANGPPNGGAFSTAAAAAESGNAYSGASASASSSARSHDSEHFGSRSAGYNRQLESNGPQSAINSQFKHGSHNGVGFTVPQKFSALESFKENRFAHGNGQLERHEGHQQVGFGGHRNGASGFNGGSANSAQAHGSGFGFSENAQEHNINSGQKGFDQGHGHFQESGQRSLGGAELGVSRGHGAGESSGQEALSGALQLASQGLQTKQSGCSTCDKTGLSQSNAKSQTGNAVALSIGG